MRRIWYSGCVCWPQCSFTPCSMHCLVELHRNDRRCFGSFGPQIPSDRLAHLGWIHLDLCCCVHRCYWCHNSRSSGCCSPDWGFRVGILCDRAPDLCGWYVSFSDYLRQQCWNIRFPASHLRDEEPEGLQQSRVCVYGDCAVSLPCSIACRLQVVRTVGGKSIVGRKSTRTILDQYKS